jgi:hypothetical protein
MLIDSNLAAKTPLTPAMGFSSRGGDDEPLRHKQSLSQHG